MTKLLFRTATAALTLALASTMSAGAFAKGKEGPSKEAPEKSFRERVKEHPDAGVGARILVEAGRFAAGIGGAVGAAAGVLLTPSKIGCGEGEQCR